MTTPRNNNVIQNAAERLDSTLIRFNNAREPDIIVRNVRWPSFEAFLVAVKALQDASNSVAESQSVRDDLRRWFDVRDYLLNSFIEPNHPMLFLNDESSWGSIADGQLGEIQTVAREAARALRSEKHHGLLALQQMISRESRIHWPRFGRTRIVVKPRAVEATRDALKTLVIPEGMTWEVCPLFTARRNENCDVTVIPGPPERLSDWRIPYAERSRHIAWLFNAPMSPHVLSISWGGASSFDAASYESNPNSPRLDARVLADAGFPRELRGFLDDDDEPLPNWRPTPDYVTREAVRCRDFILPNNYWISYGIDAGPYPTRIPLDSEYEVDIDDEHRASHLEIGDVLVLFEGSKERDLRDAFCAEWVNERRSENFETATETVSAYKAAIWARRYDPAFKTALKKAGFRDDYIQAQIARANPSDPAMGPRDQDNFGLIAQAAGWSPPPNSWEHIRLLRGGYQHAGRRIRDQLRDIVRSNQSWHDAIVAKEIAVLKVPALGRITLAPILAVVPDESLRDLEDLGNIRKR